MIGRTQVCDGYNIFHGCDQDNVGVYAFEKERLLKYSWAFDALVES